MSYGTAFRISEGDVEIDSLRQLIPLTGTDKVVQDLKVLIGSIRQSYPFNTLFGLDYTAIIASEHNQQITRNELKKTLLQHPAVNSVDEIVLASGEDRTIAASITLTLLEGEQVSMEAML